MPRRTNREEQAVEPLPEKYLLLKPEKPLIPGQRQWIPPREWERLQKARDERTRRRTTERHRQRVINAIDDWDHCLVPGCDARSAPALVGTFPRHFKDPDRFLPLCFDHLTVAWSQIERDKNESIVHVIYANLAERRLQREADEVDEAKKARLASTDGHIYLVQQNNLIKVGWTRRLRERLREYGAGVEVLGYYEATRDDETHLHRQLTPYRAKGREWYEDCKFMRDLVAEVVKQHGAPVIDLYWTEPKALSAQIRRKR